MKINPIWGPFGFREWDMRHSLKRWNMKGHDKRIALKLNIIAISLNSTAMRSLEVVKSASSGAKT